MKKILSLILTFSVLISCVNVSVFAAVPSGINAAQTSEETVEETTHEVIEDFENSDAELSDVTSNIGVNSLTNDFTTFGFDDNDAQHVDFSGGNQTVLDGVITSHGAGAWYVYLTRPYINLKDYGRKVSISFRYKQNEGTGGYVQIVGNTAVNGNKTFHATNEWQTAVCTIDTTPAKNVSDPSFIVYAVGDSISMDDFIFTPNYAFTYFIGDEEYEKQYVSPIDENGNFLDKAAPNLELSDSLSEGFLGWSLDGENVVTSVELENADVTLYAVYEEGYEGVIPDAPEVEVPVTPEDAKVSDPGINLYTQDSSKYGFDKAAAGEDDALCHFGNYGGAGTPAVKLDGTNKTMYASLSAGGVSHYLRLQNYPFEMARPITVAFDAKSTVSGKASANVYDAAVSNSLVPMTKLTDVWQTVQGEIMAAEGTVIIHAVTGGADGDVYFDNMYAAADYKFTYYVGGSVYDSVYVSPLDEDGNVALTKPTDIIMAPEKKAYTFLGWALTEGGEPVEEVTLACEDVNLYAVWGFEGTKPGVNSLTKDTTYFDFEDNDAQHVDFAGGNQSVSDGVISTTGNGAWYVYLTRSYIDLKGYGRPVTIAFKFKRDGNSGGYVQIIGNTAFEGTKTFAASADWQTAYTVADTTPAASASDPAFIIYAVSEGNTISMDDFVFAPNYVFTYYVDGLEYETEYVSALDDDGNFLESAVPSVEAPEKKGYRFLGWSTSPSATEALESVSLNQEDVVLYAVYELDENYYLGEGMAKEFDEVIEGPFGKLIYRQNFDDASSISDYEYDADFVSDYANGGASLSNPEYVYAVDGDGSNPLFTIVKDPVTGVGESLSMTGRTNYPVYRLKFDGNVLSKPGRYVFTYKSHKETDNITQKLRFYMNNVTVADTKNVAASINTWSDVATHYSKWFTQEDGFYSPQPIWYANNAFTVVTPEEFAASGMADDTYTMDNVYSMNYFDIFLEMGNTKTLYLDDIEIWYEEYADVTFVLDGTEIQMELTHRSFKPGTRLPEYDLTSFGKKLVGWSETPEGEEFSMYAKPGKVTLYPVIKTLSELGIENGLLGYEVIENLEVYDLDEINNVDYLENVFETDSFYEKALALAKAGIIAEDFSPYEYIADDEIAAINERIENTALRLEYDLVKNQAEMLIGQETEIEADFITASDEYLASLENMPESHLDVGMWLFGNYNTRQYMRYEFTPEKQVQKAQLEIHYDNSFDIYVNGKYYPSKKIDGWYTAFHDITQSVADGVNKLALRLFHTSDKYKFTSAMRGAVKLTYTDGTTRTFKTDSSGKWRFYLVCGNYECKEPDTWMTVDSLGSVSGVVHLPLWYSEHHPRALRRSMYYRNDFVVTNEVKKATLYSGAKGLYIPYINGKRVGEEKFLPGAMTKVSEYQAFDVTPLIKNGTNTIAAQTGNGWYNCESVSSLYWNKLLLMMQLEVEYEDGTKEIICTDDTWLVTASALRDNDIMFGERYDARLEIDGWNDTGINTSDWDTAVVYTGSVQELSAQDYPGTVAQELRAQKMFVLNDTSVCYDYGTNSAGRAKLVLRNTKPGEVVIVRYAEDIADNEACTEVYGDVYFTFDSLSTGKANYSARNIDTYICKGAEVEIFEPEFAYTGFRYIYVTGYSGEYTLDTVRKMDTHQNLTRIGDIKTSHEDIMALWDAVQRSYISNTIGGPQDCPTREKNFWNGDIQVYVNTANWYYDNSAYLARWSESGRKMQTGVYGWEDEEYIVPLSIYKYFGNIDVLEAKYPVLLSIIEEREGHVASDGLPTGTQPYGYSPYNDHMSTKKVSAEFYSAAFFCRMYRDAAEIATILGYTEDAAEFKEKFETARQTFNEKFYEPENSDYSPHCQGGVVIPMAFDLCEDEWREDLAAKLHEYVVQADYHQNSGFTSAEFLYIILCDYGYEEDVYKMLTVQDYPSLLYMLSTGATTMTERWDGIQPHTLASGNHYAFGSFARFMYESLGGIKIDKPAFEEITIKPSFIKEIGDIEVNHVSPYGEIISKWQYLEDIDAFEWTVTAPQEIKTNLVTPDGVVMSLDGTTQTFIVNADGTVGGMVEIYIGRKQDESNVRYAEIDGVQKQISTDSEVYRYAPDKNMLVEIVEKTSEKTDKTVSQRYFYVDAENLTATEIEDLSDFMTNESGRSIRIPDEENGKAMGLRFLNGINPVIKYADNDLFELSEYGYLIARKDQLDKSGEQLNFEADVKKVYGVAFNRTDGIDYVFNAHDDLKHIVSAVITGIPEKNYDSVIVMKSYANIIVNGEQYTVYGEETTASVYLVAKVLQKTEGLSDEVYTLVESIIKKCTTLDNELTFDYEDLLS